MYLTKRRFRSDPSTSKFSTRLEIFTHNLEQVKHNHLSSSFVIIVLLSEIASKKKLIELINVIDTKI